MDSALKCRKGLHKLCKQMRKDNIFWSSNLNLVFMQLLCLVMAVDLAFVQCQFSSPAAGNPGNFQLMAPVCLQNWLSVSCVYRYKHIKKTPLFPGHLGPRWPFQQLILASVFESKYCVCAARTTKRRASCLWGS